MKLIMYRGLVNEIIASKPRGKEYWVLAIDTGELYFDSCNGRWEKFPYNGGYIVFGPMHAPPYIPTRCVLERYKISNGEVVFCMEDQWLYHGENGIARKISG